MKTDIIDRMTYSEIKDTLYMFKEDLELFILHSKTNSPMSERDIDNVECALYSIFEEDK
jgi:hypothetical protein